MNSKELIKRNKEFAHRCVKLSINLPKSDLGNHIRRQLIRCSTSVATNYRAAILAQSDASFTAKISIVLDEKLFNAIKIEPLLSEANELKAIFCSARKTLKKNNLKSSILIIKY